MSIKAYDYVNSNQDITSTTIDHQEKVDHHQPILEPLKINSNHQVAHMIVQEVPSASLSDQLNHRETILSSSSLSSSSRSTSQDVQDRSSIIPDSIPGQLVSNPVANRIPDWYKIGWAAQINSVDPSNNSHPDESRHLDLIESFLSDVYYGTCFHNAAIIFFAVAASHYITLFGGGWSSLILILSICATYYSSSIRRVRKNARGDISRELAKQRLFQDHETVDWLNNFLDRFWLIYEPVLSATIVASVDQILIASTPSFLESIRMSTFTLGSKAPRIDFIRSHPETENDVVVMDWKFDFTPNDISDMTAKAAAGKINPKIVLTIRFGKGAIGATKDIVVENISFTGTIRIRIKLMNNFPHLQLVDLSFLEKPEFDFILKPIGFDLNMIPGLSGFIESQVHATLGPMMYDPNVFTLNLEQMLAGALVDSAIGVLQITVFNAHGLKAVKIGGGTPDPYLRFSIGSRVNLDRTKVIHGSQNPQWKSVHFLIVHSLNELLTMEIMDYNELRKDTSLGTASVDLQTFATEPEQDALTVPIIHQNKPRGEVRLSITYHPCLVPKQLESGETEPVPETSAGVVRLVIHQAKELDYKRSGTSNLSPYGKIYLNGQKILQTPVIKRTNNPVYESVIEALVPNKPNAVFTIQMFDDRHGEDPKIGSVVVKLTDLLELTAGEKKLDWFPLVGAKSGKVRVSASWKGIMMAGAINGASAYTPPIGVLRFHFVKAEDLKNVEALTGGKSDPYVRLMRSGIVLARSEIHNNNLDPVFDEIIYVPVHNVKDVFRLEVMDYQNLTKDRSLGYIDLESSKLIEGVKEGGSTIYKSTGKHQYSEYLKQEGKKALVKGQLDFAVEFHPCQRIKFRPFDTPSSDVEKLQAGGEPTDGASVVDGRGDDHSITLINPAFHSAASDLKSFAGNGIDRSGVSSSPSKSYKAGYDTASIEGSPQHTSSTAAATAPSNAQTLESKASISSLVDHRTDKQESLVTLSNDELLNCQSGILVFNIIGGSIARKHARLEFLFDDGYWPAYSTEPSKSTHPKWDETGESFIRELEWSRCMLKLNVADRDTREEVYAEYTSDLRSFLTDCLDGPHDFVLEDAEGGNRSTVSIQCRYIPVPITLEPRESINNTGILSVVLESGKDLMAADRNGYSDPYAQFVLNGLKVFKSTVQKKTLNPKWMEKFEVEIPSRVNAQFYVHVYDWDRVGASDKLGQAKIDLVNLEPMDMSTVVVNLVEGDKQQGQIKMRLTFRPHFISRSRHATSTFSGSLGRVATGLGGTVLSAGAGVGLGAAKGVGTVGGGVLKGVGGVGKLGYSGFKRATGIGNKRGSVIEEEIPAVPPIDPKLDPIVAGISKDSRAAAVVPAAVEPEASAAPGGNPAPRTSIPSGDYKLSIVVIGAVGLDPTTGKAYVHIKRNGKVVYDTKVIRHASAPEWNEVCTLDVKAGVESELEFLMYEKKKLGKDRELGSLKVRLWELVHPDQGHYEVEINEGLKDEQGMANGPVGLRVKLSVIDAGSSTSVGKEIYANSRRSFSGGNFGAFFGGLHHSGPSKEPLPTTTAAAAGQTISPESDGFLNHDPNPGNKPPSIFGSKSHRSLGAGGGKFSLHRHR